jgi:hypothetical protein
LAKKPLTCRQTVGECGLPKKQTDMDGWVIFLIKKASRLPDSVLKVVCLSI